jgi:outer membrane protein TolC
MAVLTMLMLVGCQVPADAVSVMLARQKTALNRLPAEHATMLMDASRPLEIVPSADLVESGVLPLEVARDIALQGSPDIHVARARIESALAGIAESRSLYLPQIFLTHVTTRTFDTPDRLSRFPIPQSPGQNIEDLIDESDFIQEPTPGNLIELLRMRLTGRRDTFEFSDHNSFSDHSTGLTARWVLFDGFARDAQVMIAKYRYLASAMSLGDAQRLLVQAVDAAYHQAQLSRERLRIAEADVEFSRQQLEDARKRFEVNKITRADVLNFEVRMRAAQGNMILAAGVRDLARVTLAELLALPGAKLPEDVFVAELEDETLHEMTSPDAELLIEKALQSRPDLARARYGVDASREGIELAESAYSPVVTIGGSWGYERASNMAYSTDDRSSAAAVELSWNLYAGGVREARVRQARADWWQARATVERGQLAIAAEVRSAVENVITAQEEVKLQTLTRESAEENRRVVQDQYTAGKATLVRLNQAQSDYTKTEAKLATARIRLRQAWTDLHAAVGVIGDNTAE